MQRAWLLAIAACAREPDVAPARPAVAPKPAPVSQPDPEPVCKALGVLQICGEHYEAPSHGGESSVLSAHYFVENKSEAPAELEVVELAVVNKSESMREPLAIGSVSWSGGEKGSKRTIASNERVEIDIYGRGPTKKIEYHIEYHHEVTFRVGAGEVVVDAGEMYFRYPHRL